MKAAALLPLLAAASMGAQAATLNATAYDKEGKALPHVVIFATPETGAAPAAAAKTAIVEQKGWEFSPYVMPVRVGSKVEFPNLDRTVHHVKSFSSAKEFEFFLSAEKAASPAVVFDKPGPVIVYCMMHDWMRSYIYVLDTPWFTKTADTGGATLENLPAGKYVISAWHPDLGQVLKPLTQPVTLAADGSATIKFDFAFKPRKPRAPKVLPKGDRPGS